MKHALKHSVCSYGREAEVTDATYWCELHHCALEFGPRQEEIYEHVTAYLQSGKQALVIIGDTMDDDVAKMSEDHARDTLDALFMQIYVAMLRHQVTRKQLNLPYAGNEQAYWQLASERIAEARGQKLIPQPHDGETGYSVNGILPLYENRNHHRYAPHTALVLTKMKDIMEIANSREGKIRILAIRRDIVRRFGAVSNGNELFVPEKPETEAVMSLAAFDAMNASLYRELGFRPTD